MPVQYGRGDDLDLKQLGFKLWVIVVYFGARFFNFMVPLSTQMYKLCDEQASLSMREEVFLYVVTKATASASFEHFSPMKTSHSFNINSDLTSFFD